MSEVDAALAAVGARLRELRTRRSLTLEQVSASTAISVSTLSRLESGGRRPSLDLLLPLARVYRVPLDDLVGAPPTGDPRIHPRPIRKGGRIYIPLSRQAMGVEAFKVVLPGAVASAGPEQKKHDGYEWVYVLAGSLALSLGDDVTVLEAGEAAEFDTRIPHGLASATDKPVELLSLFSAQGERIHISG